MTGAAAGAIASASVYSVSPASIGGGSIFGYTSSGSGSISLATLKGSTIARVETLVLAAVYDFEFEMSGTFTQAFFQYLTIQGSNGSVRIYRAANAANFSSSNRWSFGDGSDPVFTDTTASRALTVYF